MTTSSANPFNITAVFAFGDSIIDSGNNNFLPAMFRCNWPPYGQDLPNHLPTGRFCNGKLTTDFISSSLGLKELLPASRDPTLTDTDLLTGVSFASSGSGLDDFTTTITGAIKMTTQVKSFNETKKRIAKKVGEMEATRIIENALFVIVVGSNDMLFNFYGLRSRTLQYNSSGYHDFLLGKLDSVVESLYKLGGRKFLLASLPPIGCLPLQVTLASLLPSPHMFKRICVDNQNKDCEAYVTKIQALSSSLQAKLNNTKVTSIDIYKPTMDMIYNASKYGFVKTIESCCGSGTVELGYLCNPITPKCQNASNHLFWDAAHLTEVGYKVVADIAVKDAIPRLV